MARYRRKRPTGKEHLAASATSLLIGAGAAVASYYVARLLLAREELPQGRRDRSGSGDRQIGSRGKPAEALPASNAEGARSIPRERPPERRPRSSTP